MPAPGVIAAGIAAVRVVGGIMGKGSKNVNPVYKNVGEPKSAVKVVRPSNKGVGQTGRDLDKLKSENFKPSAKYKKDYSDAMESRRLGNR